MHSLIAACVAFVGTHFLLSHPLRAPLVARLGERGFLGAYSLVALATFGWIVLAWRRLDAQDPLWLVGDGLWALASLITLVASVLFVGSLLGNPALPQASGDDRPVPEATGVFAITRHPMMWGFALWGAAHAIVDPVPASFVLTGTIAGLALVGAALQDRKKARLQPVFWQAWQARTGYWPFARRGRFGSARGWLALAGGLALWLAATWTHIPLTGWAAGPWRWIG